ncbi:MAG: D-tyrosyl-tRNA(Tyr) deacylase [Planctomycetes bacterium]|nr:D-tyrosyl-tRNA(Tyr) deacylase [Planctomycetota bacterium]
MKALLQRVAYGRVRVDGETMGEIGPGLVVFLGVERGDGERETDRLAERVATYRVFSDAAGKINLSVLEVRGSALVVSQFTLAADTKKGRRPSFDPAAPPELAERLYRRFVERLVAAGVECRTGRFGAAMKVELENDGPVTFLLDEAPDASGGDRA